MDQIEALLAIIARYCAATNKSEATLSTAIFGAGSRIRQLRSGTTDIGVRRIAKAMHWLSSNWPEGAEWPEGVTRPVAVASPPQEPAPPPFTEAAP